MRYIGIIFIVLCFLCVGHSYANRGYIKSQDIKISNIRYDYSVYYDDAQNLDIKGTFSFDVTIDNINDYLFFTINKSQPYRQQGLTDIFFVIKKI